MSKVIERNSLPLFGVFVFCFLIGCQAARVTVESDPAPSPGYSKGGPPPWAPAHGYRAKHRYRYYPSSRVYYAEDRGVYFYYRGGEWRVSASLPSYIRIDAGDYVTLEMDNDRPYEYQGEVERRYPPGQLKKRHRGKGNSKWD
jgi:hypothetical protein